MSEGPEIFQIPEQNMAKLHAEIAKINKRADKIGVPRLEVVDHGIEYQPDHSAVDTRVCEYDETRAVAKQYAPKVAVHHIEIGGDGPKIEGYTFVGSLDHYSLPGDVLIKTVPGETIPQSHYNAQPVCDHCGKIRPRKNTYVLRNDKDGSHMQVGSQCVRDFIGYNPEQAARFLERVWQLAEDMREEGNIGSSAGGPVYFDKIETLKITAAMIRNFGWVSRTRAEDTDDQPTSRLVSLIVDPPRDNVGKKERRQLVDQTEWNDQADLTEAKAAYEWILSKNDSNEYMANLIKLANAEAIPQSGFGVWVSLIAAYQREQDKLREKARQFKTNDWVGEVKQRRQFTGELIGLHRFSGQFGDVVIHRLIDDNGHTLVWFANTDSKMEKGHTYRFTATVKKHDKYNEWCQTHINRVKVNEDLGVITTE